jgi:hypothetical protein
MTLGYVPEDAEWYIAELVQELVVADDPRNVVWRNLTLVHASFPDDAYEKAQSLGRAGNSEYLNPAGKLVTTRFRGISFMDVVHDPLEHGAELLFYSQTQVSEEDIAKLLRSKEQLNLFSPITRGDGPDVASGDIVREAESISGARRPDSDS